MAVFDRQTGQGSDLVPAGWAINFVDAMGRFIPFVIFLETESGLVRRWKTDERGDPVLDEDGNPIEIIETRPAPIRFGQRDPRDRVG